MAVKSRGERRRLRKRRWFDQAEVEAYIREAYPACPDFAVTYYANYICTVPKNWRGAPIATAVEVTIENELRHQHTDYDQLTMVGVRRKAARQRVQPRIDAIVAGWKALPVR